MKQLTWAIYIRVSTRHQAEDGFSLEQQRETLTDYAEQTDRVPFRVFEDAGISGETLDDRPAMVELLDAVGEGEVVGVLVVDESRLARDEFIAASIRNRLKKAGVKLAIPGRGELDLSDPSDNFTANVLAAAHALEQDMRTVKMKKGIQRTVHSGFWPGGPAPYGYRLAPDPGGSKHKVLEIDEEQAGVIRRVVNMILNEGHSTYSACKALNADGVRTERGSLWRHPNLRGHLRKPHLTGTWIYKPTTAEEITMTIPAILDQETWDRLQEAIQGSPRPQRKHRTYPLTGKQRNHLRCDCGGNYSGKTDVKKRFSTYVCSGSAHEFGVERCPHSPRSIRRVDIETTLIEKLKPVFTEDYLRQLAETVLPDPDGGDYRNEIGNVRAKIDRRRAEKVRLARKHAEDDTLDFLGDAISDIDAEIEDLESELGKLQHRMQLQVDRATIEEQIEHIARQMGKKLHYLDDSEYAQLADILQIDLERVGSHQFVGSASVPLDLREVHEEGLRRP